MSQYRLTGRRRYREHKRWLRRSLLVLQVEEEFRPDRYFDITYTDWRDAGVEDLMIIPASVQPLRVVK